MVREEWCILVTIVWYISHYSHISHYSDYISRTIVWNESLSVSSGVLRCCVFVFQCQSVSMRFPLMCVGAILEVCVCAYQRYLLNVSG